MRLLAPAKINLHLRVGPRRQDGFHPLLSWMTTVGLFDNLILEKQAFGDASDPGARGAGSGAETGGTGRYKSPPAPLSLLCDLPGLPCDEGNLVVRIATAFAAELQLPGGGWRTQRASGDPQGSPGDRAANGPGEVFPIRASLQKRIPVGAGLGGGSSDAARTLLGLDRLWKSRRSADDLSAFAARFGSDLSFFIHGPSSICGGRGELVRPIAKPSARWAVLVLPRLSMPTADVYRRFDDLGLGRDSDVASPPDWDAWAKLGSEQLLPLLVNDLEPPAFAIAPQLAALRERVEKIARRIVRMSGSGSSLFTLFDAETEAREASARIEHETGETAPAIEVSPIIRDDLNETFANQ